MRSWQHPQHARDWHPTTDVMVYDIETVVDTEPTDGSFPPIPAHRPVAAAFLRATWSPGDHYTFRLDVPVCQPGNEPAFFAEVDRCLTGTVGVGFNSRGFDNPVLRMQAMACRAFSLNRLARQTQAGRYENMHCDLADQLAGHGSSRTPSLAAVCGALDIPVKTATHGSDVGELWRAGDVEAIMRYVGEDVVATYLVWLHWAAWRDSDLALMALPLADLAVWLEQTPDLEHLRVFATCSAARWARQQAPAIRAGMAAGEAERRLTRERDEAAFSA